MEVFRGLKFEPNAEIGENSHLLMHTGQKHATVKRDHQTPAGGVFSYLLRVSGGAGLGIGRQKIADLRHGGDIGIKASES